MYQVVVIMWLWFIERHSILHNYPVTYEEMANLLIIDIFLSEFIFYLNKKKSRFTFEIYFYANQCHVIHPIVTHAYLIFYSWITAEFVCNTN